MKNTYLLLVSTLLITLYACDDDYNSQPIDVTYDTLPFEDIRLETSSDVRIIQANYFQVIISGPQTDVNNTNVFVDQGQLVIDEFGHHADNEVIRIYVPVFNQLESTGSSNVYGESQFHQNGNMELILSGSGEIDMYVDADNLDAYLSGSGAIYLEGQMDNVDYHLSGSGWVHAFNLFTDFTDVRITGSGSAEVTVDNDLDVNISGSGDVFYKGHPFINTQISGSGHVIDAN